MAKLLNKFGNLLQIAIGLVKAEKRLDELERRVDALEAYAWGGEPRSLESGAAWSDVMDRGPVVLVADSPKGGD